MLSAGTGLTRHTRWNRRCLGNTILASLVLLAGLSYRYAALPKSIAYGCFREISKYQMHFQTRNWKSLSGSNFVVRFHPQDVAVAELVLETAEDAVQPVNELLGFTPKEKSLILIYPTKGELGKSFGWGAEQGAMGVYWAGVIRVLSPREWIKDVSGRGIEEVFRSSGPMVHEYTHLAADYITRGNYPRWLTEGVAQYAERKITGFVFTDNLIRPGDEWYPLAELDSHFDEQHSQAKAYRQSLALIDCLVESYGEDGLRSILQELGRGVDIDSVWKEELGISIEDFEKGFIHWTLENAA